MRGWIVGACIFAVAGIAAFTKFAPTSPQCFREVPPVVPAFDGIEISLTKGTRGRLIYQAVAEGDTACVEALVTADLALLSDPFPSFGSTTIDLATCARPDIRGI